MRYAARIGIVIAALVLALTGCSRVVTGLAAPDPRGPGVAVTPDGYGIVVGDADAPVQLELYTEPQCDHCAHFQEEYGEEIKTYVADGRLALTYRVLTFGDDAHAIDYSAMVANALFLTVTPETSAVTFQTYVETLWANQDLAHGGYSVGDLAELAGRSGIDAATVDAIAGGDVGVDTTEMDAVNDDALQQISDMPGTPTVYSLDAEEIVDTSHPKWLSALMHPV